MPPKLTLIGFLRHDLLSRRTRALIPYYNDYNASRNPILKRGSEGTNSLPPRLPSPLSDNGKSDAKPAQDVDSPFGEPIYTEEDILQQKLELLLAQDLKHKQDTKHRGRNPELDKLKEELNVLVNRELEASREERELIRRQKLGLISAIGKLEAKIRGERVKGCKGGFSPILKSYGFLGNKLERSKFGDIK
jgi:hypothetical protein